MTRLRKLTLAEKLGIKEGFNVTVAGLSNKMAVLDFGVYTTYKQLPRVALLRALNQARQLIRNLPEEEKRKILANAMSWPIGQCSGWVQGHHIPGVQWSFRRPSGLQDLVLHFARSRVELAAELPTLKSWLAEHGALWIACPKANSEIVPDLNRQTVINLARKNGLNTVKSCNIDRQWSAEKFMLVCAGRKSLAGAK